MSLNPVLATDQVNHNELFPLPAPGEVFILKRAKIKFVVECSTKKYAGKGMVYLTSTRVVFVRDQKNSKDFSSIELPHSLVTGVSANMPEFRQPIFGANYLEGHCEPLKTSTKPLPTPARWSIRFVNGGCQAFINVYYATFLAAKKKPSSNNAQPYVNTVESCGFFDPTDPSVFYVTQPQVTPTGQLSYQGQTASSPQAPVYQPVSNYPPMSPVGAMHNNQTGGLSQPNPTAVNTLSSVVPPGTSVTESQYYNGSNHGGNSQNTVYGTAYQASMCRPARNSHESGYVYEQGYNIQQPAPGIPIASPSLEGAVPHQYQQRRQQQSYFAYNPTT